MSAPWDADLWLRLLPRLEAHGDVTAAWLEGAGPPRSVPAVGDTLDLHVGAPDPALPALAAALPGLFREVLGAALSRWEPAPFEGLTARADLGGGRTLVVTLERMSLVGRRPRRALRLLLDKTGRFLGGLTYAETPPPDLPPDPPGDTDAPPGRGRSDRPR